MSRPNPINEIIDLANSFDTDAPITTLEAHGSGNINDTYLAISSSGKKYILQKVNTAIFKTPKTVMQNMAIVTKSIHHQIASRGIEWKIQYVISTKDGENYLEMENGSFWRMISFIENSSSFDVIDTDNRAYELGRALGLFHSLLDDISMTNVEYALESFHIAPEYLREYDEANMIDDIPVGSLEDQAHKMIGKFRDSIGRLESAKRDGILPLRIIHGDPKINNIMFDIHSGRAVSMIDLDTIQPGLVHYDIGDCARSSCNTWGEEERDSWSSVKFDVNIFANLWRGYLSEAGNMISDLERDYVYDSLFILAFETGIRFFTDYLNGDVYFKTNYPENNLYRGLVQLTLAQSIYDQQEQIKSIIAKEP